jgi:hypothetical protein
MRGAKKRALATQPFSGSSVVPGAQGRPKGCPAPGLPRPPPD